MDMKYAFSFLREPSPNYMQVYFTSEGNSNGIIFHRWFEGYVNTKHKMKKNKILEVHIEKTTEYINLESSCSNDTYYQCLAKRISKLQLRKVSLPESLSECSGEPNCPPEGNCVPFLLLSDNDNAFLCENGTGFPCYECIMKKMTSNQEKLCKRSCLVKEYKTKNDGEHELTTENVTQFQLDVNFEPPFGTVDIMSNAPFKIVKREYLIMTWMSFVGNVGGTLGLFVGFSFVTTSEWFVDATVVVWNRMRRVINKPTVKP